MLSQDPHRAWRAAAACAGLLSLLVITLSTVLGAFSDETHRSPWLGLAQGVFAAAVLLPLTALASAIVGLVGWAVTRHQSKARNRARV